MGRRRRRRRRRRGVMPSLRGELTSRVSSSSFSDLTSFGLQRSMVTMVRDTSVYSLASFKKQMKALGDSQVSLVFASSPIVPFPRPISLVSPRRQPPPLLRFTLFRSKSVTTSSSANASTSRVESSRTAETSFDSTGTDTFRACLRWDPRRMPLS